MCRLDEELEVTRQQLEDFHARLAGSDAEIQRLQTETQTHEAAQQQWSKETERAEWLEQELEQSRTKVLHLIPPELELRASAVMCCALTSPS